MISLILLSAGLAYFLSLPFAAVLQGGGYRLSALLRAKKQFFACVIFFMILAAGQVAVVLLTRGVAERILSFSFYAVTATFVFAVHRSVRIEMHFTHRLIRLLIVFVISYIVFFVGFYFTPFCALWASLPLLAPILLALISAVISPIEKKNNQRYVKRAQKTLAASTAIKIGITGSYGKTSVKRYMEQLLSIKYNTLATPENYNTPLGIAKTMENATGKEDFLLLEMGARRRGDIRELCQIVRPDLGVITGIAPQHLETFQTLTAVLEEKNELALSVLGEAPVFYNLTDDFVRSLYERRKGKKIGVGYQNADYLISEEKYSADGSTFVLAKGERKEIIKTPLIGKAAVIDLAIAAAVAIEQGVSWDGVAFAAKRIFPPAHRFEVVKRGEVTVIDDSYNINPVGAKAALDTLHLFEGKRKVVYTSGMVELGEKEEELNVALGRMLAKTADIAVVGEGRYGDAVVCGIGEGDTEVLRVANTKEASALFSALLQAGDVLLIMSDLPRDYLL